MRVKESTVNDFFALTGTIFSIPVYQRNYIWEEKNCEKLLQDIINISQNKKTHFMGSITYILHLIDDEKSLRKLQEFVIIDGQQRITTIMLLLKAIETKIPNEEIKKEIDGLLNLTGQRLRLKPIKATKKPLIWSCKIDRMNCKAYHTSGTIIDFSPKSLTIISTKGIA
ncbi:hypothetical protein HpDR19_03420 [Helicobacter pylori]